MTLMSHPLVLAVVVVTALAAFFAEAIVTAAAAAKSPPPRLTFPAQFHLNFIAYERSSRSEAQREEYSGTVSRDSNGDVSALVKSKHKLHTIPLMSLDLYNDFQKQRHSAEHKESTLLYQNGFMALDGECVADLRNVPPVIPDFDAHLLENAMPLFGSMYGSHPDRARPFPLTFDREVNLCITKGWSPWVVTYHGEPFVLCIDQIEKAAGAENLVSFVPKRIIGSTTLIDITIFRPGQAVQDLSALAKNTLFANEAGSCQRTLLSSNNGATTHPAVNVVSESVPAAAARGKQNVMAPYADAPLAQRLQRAYEMSRLSRSDANPRVKSTVSKMRKEDRDNLKLFWFYSFEVSCQRDWIRDQSVCDMWRGTNANDGADGDQATKTCIFLHGVGQSDEDKGDPVSSFPEYWGNVEDYTPQCKERVFIREETKKRGWDSRELQESYCRIALWGQPEGDRIIKNKILYVHSMGNLILAAAIKNGVCDLDILSTTWYDLQGPFRGSKAASTLVEICAAVGSGWTEPVPALYYYVASKGGYCIPGTNSTYEAYRTLDPSYPGLSDLYPVAARKISGFLCGDSAIGLYSMYSPLLEILSLIVQYGERSDGMVPLSSCNPNSVDHNPDHRQPQYLGPVNHADGTCRNGDGRWGIDRKPCSYYAERD